MTSEYIFVEYLEGLEELLMMIEGIENFKVVYKYFSKGENKFFE